MAILSISEVLRKLLFNRNMKLIDLARATNVPQPTVQRIVSGNCIRPHMNSLAPIAEFFDISIDQLSGKEPITWLEDPSKQLAEVGLRRVPLLEWNEILPWIHEAKENELNTQNKPCKAPKVITESPVSLDAFALTVKDSAMEPIFPVGTQIIFDLNKPFRDRYYVLVKLQQHKEPIFRQLILDAGDQFVKPLSPDLEHFRMYQLTPDDAILGVLVEAKHRYAE